MQKIIIEQFGGPDVLKYVNVPMPSISSTEVLIRTKAFSVNFADVKNRQGKKAKGPFPLSLGLDVAGIVEAVGADVSEIKVGDRVVAFAKDGSYSEYAVSNAALTYPLPEALSFERGAACLTVGFLSYVLTHELVSLTKDSRVIVHAASGGVGTTLLQMLSQIGVKTIIAVTSSAKKFELLKSLGATHTFTYNTFVEEVQAVTDGVDVIFDSVAGEVTTNSFQCLRPYGTLLQFGNSSGQLASWTNRDVHESCRTVKGFSLGTTRKLRPRYLQKLAPNVLKTLSNTTILIDRTYDFTEIQQAHERIEDRAHSGKIVVCVEQ